MEAIDKTNNIVNKFKKILGINKHIKNKLKTQLGKYLAKKVILYDPFAANKRLSLAFTDYRNFCAFDYTILHSIQQSIYNFFSMEKDIEIFHFNKFINILYEKLQLRDKLYKCNFVYNKTTTKNYRKLKTNDARLLSANILNESIMAENNPNKHLIHIRELVGFSDSKNKQRTFLIIPFSDDNTLVYIYDELININNENFKHAFNSLIDDNGNSYEILKMYDLKFYPNWHNIKILKKLNGTQRTLLTDVLTSFKFRPIYDIDFKLLGKKVIDKNDIKNILKLSINDINKVELISDDIYHLITEKAAIFLLKKLEKVLPKDTYSVSKTSSNGFHIIINGIDIDVINMKNKINQEIFAEMQHNNNDLVFTYVATITFEIIKILNQLKNFVNKNIQSIIKKYLRREINVIAEYELDKNSLNPHHIIYIEEYPNAQKQFKKTKVILKGRKFVSVDDVINKLFEVYGEKYKKRKKENESIQEYVLKNEIKDITYIKCLINVFGVSGYFSNKKQKNSAYKIKLNVNDPELLCTINLAIDVNKQIIDLVLNNKKLSDNEKIGILFSGLIENTISDDIKDKLKEFGEDIKDTYIKMVAVAEVLSRLLYVKNVHFPKNAKELQQKGKIVKYSEPPGTFNNISTIGNFLQALFNFEDKRKLRIAIYVILNLLNIKVNPNKLDKEKIEDVVEKYIDYYSDTVKQEFWTKYIEAFNKKYNKQKERLVLKDKYLMSYLFNLFNMLLKQILKIEKLRNLLQQTIFKNFNTFRHAFINFAKKILLLFNIESNEIYIRLKLLLKNHYFTEKLKRMFNYYTLTLN